MGHIGKIQPLKIYYNFRKILTQETLTFIKNDSAFNFYCFIDFLKKYAKENAASQNK